MIFKANFFINELFLTLFMILCLFLAFTNPREMDRDKFKSIQMSTIVMICIVAGLNIVIFLANLIVQIKNLIQNMKKKKESDDEKRKTLLEEHRKNTHKVDNPIDEESEEDHKYPSDEDQKSRKKSNVRFSNEGSDNPPRERVSSMGKHIRRQSALKKRKKKSSLSRKYNGSSSGKGYSSNSFGDSGSGSGSGQREIDIQEEEKKRVSRERLGSYNPY